MLTTKIHCVRFGMCEVRRLKWALPVFHKTAKHFRCIKYENIKRQSINCEIVRNTFLLIYFYFSRLKDA